MTNHDNGVLRRRNNNLHKEIQARMVMETRQRDRRAPQQDDDEDAPAAETISLTPPPRLTRARPTETETTTSTPARVRQPLTTETSIPVDEALTTSSTSTRARPTTTSSTTTEEEEETTTSTTPTTTSTTPSTTSTPTTTSTIPTTTTPRTTSTPTTTARTTTPVRSTTTSSALSSSVAPIGAADANASTSGNDSGTGSNAGTIAGVIIALVVVAAIAAFFGLRWRKKRQRAAEDAAIFPGGGAGPAAAAGAAGVYGNKRSSKGYNQHLNSYDDVAGAGAGIGADGANTQYGEKWGEDDSTPNMAGFGSRMSDNYASHEKNPGAGMAGYGTLSMASGMNRVAGHNDAVRGSFSQQSLLGRDASGGFSPLSPGQYVSSPAFQPGYPPVGPGFPPSSPAARMSGGAPTAAMMSHAPAAHMSDALPPHQINDLNNAIADDPSARRISHQDSNAIALQAAAAAAAAGLAASAANAPVAGPFEDPATEGKVHVVVRTFEPTMPDELVIFPGDKVQIVMEYDDGWCLGCNLTSAVRDGQEPGRGVFPRDCVDLFVPSAAPLTPPGAGASSRAFGTIAEEDEDAAAEDRPLTSGHSGLSRAPTLPPFETSRFSMGDGSAGAQQRNSMVGSANTNRQSLSVPGQNRQSMLASPQPDQVPLPASRGVSMLSSAPAPSGRASEDVDAEDAYGGLGSSGVTPTSPGFPPNIHVSPSPAMPAPSPKHTSAMTTATTEDNTGDLLDEFPSTPRTENGTASQHPTPVNGGPGFNRLSMPKSASNRSLKRTSSLIASKDADLFLALGDSLGRDERHV